MSHLCIEMYDATALWGWRPYRLDFLFHRIDTHTCGSALAERIHTPARHPPYTQDTSYPCRLDMSSSGRLPSCSPSSLNRLA